MMTLDFPLSPVFMLSLAHLVPPPPSQRRRRNVKLLRHPSMDTLPRHPPHQLRYKTMMMASLRLEVDEGADGEGSEEMTVAGSEVTTEGVTVADSVAATVVDSVVDSVVVIVAAATVVVSFSFPPLDQQRLKDTFRLPWWQG